MKLRSISAAAAFLGLAASAPIALWACEDSTTGAEGSTTPGPTVSVPTSSPTGPNGADSGAGDDGSTPTDGGNTTADIPKKQTLKIMNLSGAPINACIRSEAVGQPGFTTPAYRAAGIPDGAMSQRVLVPDIGSKELKIIAAGGSCADAALATQTGLFAGQGEDTHATFWYRSSGGQNAGTILENVTPTAGKDTVAYVLFASTREPNFVRDDGMGAPIPLRAAVFGDNVLLDGDLVGKFVSPGQPAVERPVKTVSGGTIDVFALETKTILCDDRAPAVDGLSNCSDSLRAP